MPASDPRQLQLRRTHRLVERVYAGLSAIGHEQGYRHALGIPARSVDVQRALKELGPLVQASRRFQEVINGEGVGTHPHAGYLFAWSSTLMDAYGDAARRLDEALGTTAPSAIRELAAALVHDAFYGQMWVNSVDGFEHALDRSHTVDPLRREHARSYRVHAEQLASRVHEDLSEPVRGQVLSLAGALPARWRARAVDLRHALTSLRGEPSFEMMGVDVREAGMWAHTGATPYAAAAWIAYGFEHFDYEEWTMSGVTDAAEAWIWHRMEATPREAARWRKRGVGPETAAQWRTLGYRSPKQVGPWIALREPSEIHAWKETSLPAEAAEAWLSTGLSAADARRFFDAKVPASTAETWVSAGFSAVEALLWVATSMPPEEAQAYLALGCTPGEAAAWRQHNADPESVRRWHEKGARTPDEAKGLLEQHRLAQSQPPPPPSPPPQDWVSAVFSGWSTRYPNKDALRRFEAEFEGEGQALVEGIVKRGRRALADPANESAQVLDETLRLLECFELATTGDRAQNVALELRGIDGLKPVFSEADKALTAMVRVAKARALLARIDVPTAEGLLDAERVVADVDVLVRQHAQPVIWGRAQYLRGVIALRQSEIGQRSKCEDAYLFLRNAIGALQGQVDAIELGEVVLALGDVLMRRRKGDPAQNRQSAMDNYRQAGGVLRAELAPDAWARLQLSAASAVMTDSARAASHGPQAMDRLVAAIQFVARRNRPRLLAELQRSAARLLHRRRDGDRRQHLGMAIEFVKSAGAFYSVSLHPFEWQELQQLQAAIRQDAVRLR